MRPEVNDVASYFKRTGAKLTYLPRRRAATSVVLAAGPASSVRMLAATMMFNAQLEHVLNRRSLWQALGGGERGDGTSCDLGRGGSVRP
jgi:hypothetical protein